MRAPKEIAWEKTLSRYFAACGIPLKWEYVPRRYTGIAGHVFARINPKDKNPDHVWNNMPRYIKQYEQKSEGKNAVVFITNKQYGDSVDDSLVILRIGTFIPMLKAFVESDKERWKE